MSAVAVPRLRGIDPHGLRLEDLGELVPISRLGGQGRVYRPAVVPPWLGPGPVVVKVYRRSPPGESAHVLTEMVAWGRSLPAEQRLSLDQIAAWPLAIVRAGIVPAGIAMRDVSGRFSVPFVMPSGRRERVLLTLEHLLGADSYLQMRGLGVRLDTAMRARVAERVSAGLAFLHRHGIAASDIAPNNLLVGFRSGLPTICFIDCDSMVLHGRQALTAVQTGDWDIPAEFAETSNTRAADAYKLGLVVLRLFARSHDARTAAPHLRYLPVELRDLLDRSLAPDSVNRPPAGEWQRALHGVLADGSLNERCPGPVPAPRPPATLSPAATAPRSRSLNGHGGVPPAPATGRPYQWPQPAPAVFPRPQSAGSGRPQSAGSGRPRSGPAAGVWLRPQPAAGVWLRRAVVVAWIVAGTAVLALLLSRMFADAIPVPGNGRFGQGSSAGATTPYVWPYGYYVPQQQTQAGNVTGPGGFTGP